jgi:hypothetical protein
MNPLPDPLQTSPHPLPRRGRKDKRLRFALSRKNFSTSEIESGNRTSTSELELRIDTSLSESGNENSHIRNKIKK